MPNEEIREPSSSRHSAQKKHLFQCKMTAMAAGAGAQAERCVFLPFTCPLLRVLGFGTIHEEGEELAGRVNLAQHFQDGSHILAHHVFRLAHLGGRGGLDDVNNELGEAVD